MATSSLPLSCSFNLKRLVFSFLIFLILNKIEVVQAQIVLQLTPSNYNGYNISCFGYSDGSIDLEISGGTPPYQILWSIDNNNEDLNNIPAGYYNVRVTDSDSIPLISYAEITLNEPRKLIIESEIYEFPNHYNISAFDACNGSINLSGLDGVQPYSWLWNDSSASLNRSPLCADKYFVTLTDANNCRAKETFILTQPERGDWQVEGNEGMDANLNFIGNIDSVNLVFKTNNSSRLEIGSAGTLKIPSFAGNSSMVYVDSLGILKTGTPTNPVAPCAPGQIVAPVWYSMNIPSVLYTCPTTSVGIGTWAPHEKFEVAGNAVFTETIGTAMTSSPMIVGKNTYVQSTESTPDFTWRGNLNTGIFHPEENTIAFTNGGTESMRIIYDANAGGAGNPKVVIGAGLNLPTATTNNYSLYVSRGILAEKVKVAISSSSEWSDKVFFENYKLLSLKQLKEFIEINNHLPGIPNADEVVACGVDVGTMMAKLLEKIEELTLHVINLEEKLNESQSSKK